MSTPEFLLRANQRSIEPPSPLDAEMRYNAHHGADPRGKIPYAVGDFRETTLREYDLFSVSQPEHARRTTDERAVIQAFSILRTKLACNAAAWPLPKQKCLKFAPFVLLDQENGDSH